MHMTGTLLKGPGTYLVLMTWWVFVFFVVSLRSYPIAHHLSSYLPFFIAFAVSIAFGLTLNLTNARWSFWLRLPLWAKILTLIAGYAANVVVILIITVTLDSYRLIDYFGGDPEGSFGMLYIPSAAAYSLLAALAIVALKVKQVLVRKGS